MKFEPALESGVLIKRYKRFLADIRLDDGTQRTIHCANTGSMTGCAEPGNRVYYSTSSNTKRKYPNSWELSVTKQQHTICVNTIRANQLVIEAIETGVIKELQGYSNLQAEVKYGSENSRIDILLQDEHKPDCYIEVKSATLLSQDEHEQNEGQGYFPDAVTTRGQKHLRELTEAVENGSRSILFFAVLHSGIEKVSSAHHIDPTYHSLLNEARKKGVEVICYNADFSANEMKIKTKLPFIT